MSFDMDRLYELLPAIHRIRDQEQGGALRALLSVIADQVAILEEDLAQLYDEQFIETCAPWVVPYIGDLIGSKGLPSARPGIITPRAEVAHTIGYRRRKGTAAVLEQLARDVTSWPARAVECFQILATTQYMNHLRPENRSFVTVRGANRLESLGGAFEHLDGAQDLTHTVDVRRIASGRGRYNIPNVGLFLWRLRAYPATGSPVVPSSPGDRRHFHFSPLGHDAPLFNLPVTEADITHLAEPVNVPDRISRRVLARHLSAYYGEGKSLLLTVGGTNVLPDPNDPAQRLSDLIAVCDLTDWMHQPADQIAIDPVLGRLAFPGDLEAPPLVTFHYGFSADIGGGEYNRSASFDIQLNTDEPDAPTVQIRRVAKTGAEFSTIQAALEALEAGPVIIEITDNGRYEETVSSIDAANRTIELRAADQRRPTLVLSNDVQITGGEQGRLSLNGLLISGATLQTSGALGHLRLRHCTLVPGITLATDGTPSQPSTSSLMITSAGTSVDIEDSILGGLQVDETAQVRLVNSIVDATDRTGVAYAATDGESAGGMLHVENSTVIGKVHTVLMEMASNTLFVAEVSKDDDTSQWRAALMVLRRQEGCIRFSFLPPGAITPRRHRCQPEMSGHAARVRPIFSSLRYGQPEYCQLRSDCPDEIRRGADDESEMGALHDLYQAQRENHLRTRLDEYLRFGLEAGLFYAT